MDPQAGPLLALERRSALADGTRDGVGEHGGQGGVQVVDLLERPVASDDLEGLQLSLRPFQIVTLRFAR